MYKNINKVFKIFDDMAINNSNIIKQLLNQNDILFQLKKNMSQNTEERPKLTQVADLQRDDMGLYTSMEQYKQPNDIDMYSIQKEMINVEYSPMEIGGTRHEINYKLPKNEILDKTLANNIESGKFELNEQHGSIEKTYNDMVKIEIEEKKQEDTIINELSIQEKKQKKTIMDELDSQEEIWERIRKSSIAMNIENNKEDDFKNEILKSIKDHVIHTKDCPKKYEFGPPINALYKVSPYKRKEIIKNIFIQATENINNLAKINSSYKENIDKLIQDEADRLLEVYLKTH